MKHSKYLKGAGSMLLLVAVAIVTAGIVWAQSTNVNISGYLWSSHVDQEGSTVGAGWLATDCAISSDKGGDICSQSNFKLELDAQKNINGYIWSSNIGWVKFGGLSGCPAGSCKARLVESGNNYEMMGWARACSVYKNGCSGSLRDDVERGGWDGWISLNCANHNGCGKSNYKVTVNAEGWIPADAYAWGGDIMGAVNFSLASMQCTGAVARRCADDQMGIITTDALCSENITQCSNGQLCDPKTVTCKGITKNDINAEIIFGSDIVRAGDTTTVRWNFVDAPPAGTVCHVLSTTGHNVTTNGGVSEVMRAGEVEYVLYCSVNNGAEIEVDRRSLRAAPAIMET